MNRVLFLCFLFPIYLSAAPQANEHLEYTISYQGAFTAMASLDICDAVLEVSQQTIPVSGEMAYKALVEITSEHHEEMESLYPFRFQLLSYFSRDMQRSLLFERRKKTRKERHEVVRFNWAEKVTERYKRRKSSPVTLGASEAEAAKKSVVFDLFALLGYERVDFRRSGKAGQKLSGSMLDRLSLLQAVRSQKLVVGQEKRFTISDGKKILNYLVRVQTRKPLEDSGQKRELIKVRFDAFKDGKWKGTPAHPTVFIWMTADEHQTPIRFSVDYAMGTFVIQLKQKIERPSAIVKTESLVQRPQAH